jgi:hypothetical protein
MTGVERQRMQSNKRFSLRLNRVSKALQLCVKSAAMFFFAP